MYSFLQLNIIKFTYILTNTIGLGQFNKSDDVGFLDVIQCENCRVLKCICAY